MKVNHFAMCSSSHATPEEREIFKAGKDLGPFVNLGAMGESWTLWIDSELETPENWGKVGESLQQLGKMALDQGIRHIRFSWNYAVTNNVVGYLPTRKTLG